MATFNFHGSANQRKIAEIAVFGKLLTESDYDNLAGDLTGDAVIDGAYDEGWLCGGGSDARIRIHAKNALATTKVRLIPGRFDFLECKVPIPKCATGARILLKLALAAKFHGFARITGRGERAVDRQTGNLTSVGFYAFPRLGFDAVIPTSAPVCPSSLASCLRLSDLMDTGAGKEFWLKSGVEVETMEFDLANNSLSWKRLIASHAAAIRLRAYQIWEERSHEPLNEWDHSYKARDDPGIPEDFHLYREMIGDLF